ncbi:MAG: cardiolipin synthase [Prevotella sp.]|jgi:cardiolipin synthase
MQFIHWFLLVAYTITILVVMLKILMDNRQPAKTMAWMLVLLFVPLAGIIFYFFFGQNTRKEKLVSQKSLDQLTKRSMLEFAEQRDLRLPESHRPLMLLFKNQSMALPFKDNLVDIFTTGYDFFPVLLREISRATDHIHLDWFIFADDPLGNMVADALINKAQEGVEVRLIYDDVGCWNVPNKFFERLRDGGVDVHAFLPVRFPMATSKANYRNHRKLCVIDGRVAFLGGMNIARRYVQGTDQPWRDTHLMLRGGAVYGVQRAFLVDWYFVDRTLITDRKYYPPVDATINNNCIAQVVTSSPITPWPDIMQGYVRILLEARRYVYMESPYFLPTEPILFAMRTAALTGVDVRLMIPYKSDSRVVEWASVSYVREVLEAGVHVYMYQGGFNHSKLMVCDDSISTVGSTNVDFRSFEHDFESNVFFYDEGMALRLKKIFLDDQRQCVDATSVEKIRHCSFLRRLWESLLRLLSPLL